MSLQRYAFTVKSLYGEKSYGEKSHGERSYGEKFRHSVDHNGPQAFDPFVFTRLGECSLHNAGESNLKTRAPVVMNHLAKYSFTKS